MGAVDNLRSSLAEEAVITLETGHSSKQVLVQRGIISEW